MDFQQLRRYAAIVALAFAPLAAAVQAASPAPSLPTDAQGWSRAAQQDIREAYGQFVENHPGMHDPSNPGFPELLRQARDAGLALADRVNDAAGYRATLARFTTVVADGHFGIQARLPESASAQPKWPGFVAVWRGQGLYVYASEPGGPPAGAQVLACDGAPIRDLIIRNVFTYRGRVREEGQWWTQARAVFIDDGNPFVTPPRTCEFTQAGRKTIRALTWRAVDDVYARWRAVSYNGDVLPAGLTEPRPGLIWIAMPTFQPDDSQVAAYRQIFQSVHDQRDRFLQASAIVIDLRNNQGGSSEWSAQLAQALWGTDRVNRRMHAYSGASEAWWRASADNAAYVAGEVSFLRAQHRDRIADAWLALGEKLKDAHAKGETYWVQMGGEDFDAPIGDQADPANANRNLPTDPPALRTTVYVIVGGQCASACLDALDVFTRFDNTKLVGAPTSADTTYLDVRTRTLSSGLAQLVMSNKMWVHRPRAAGEIYRPAIVNTDLAWTTKSFRDLIEADLKARKTRSPLSPATPARSATDG